MPPCGRAAKRCSRAVRVRRSVSSVRIWRASASLWRAARRKRPCRNQVAMPPARTPSMATAMITTNSGRVTATVGVAELKGSKETVTKWRLATAKMMKKMPRGMMTTAEKNFRTTISRRNQGRRPGPATAALQAERPLEKRLIAGVHGLAVQPLAHFFAGLEERYALLVDRHMRAGARIAPGTRRTVLDREGAKAAQLDPVAAR